jgi:hypothetical protein
MEQAVLCKNCVKQVGYMKPGYMGCNRMKPGYDCDFESAQELKDAVASGDIYTVFVRASRPADQTHYIHEFSIPIEQVNSSTPQQLDRFVLETLVSQIAIPFHQKYCLTNQIN